MKDVNLPAVVTGRKNVKASPKNEPTLLVILNGYFNEIIHSINGVSSVLICNWYFGPSLYDGIQTALSSAQIID